MRLDPFAAPEREKVEEKDEADEPLFESDEDRRIYEMQQQTRAEQLERIRRMLARDENVDEHKESSEE